MILLIRIVACPLIFANETVIFRPEPVRTGNLGRRRLEISTFASGGQSLFLSCLPVFFPVFTSALTAAAIGVAESLFRALNFKERPTPIIGANADVAWLKKLPPRDAAHTCSIGRRTQCKPETD
jgi:hypothetical protein